MALAVPSVFFLVICLPPSICVCFLMHRGHGYTHLIICLNYSPGSNPVIYSVIRTLLSPDVMVRLFRQPQW